jgi:hypothetical protein
VVGGLVVFFFFLFLVASAREGTPRAIPRLDGALVGREGCLRLDVGGLRYSDQAREHRDAGGDRERA